MTAPNPATLEREKDKHIPAWVDKARLCEETCLGEMTVDRWVESGDLPPPVKRRGKLMWEWSEVHDWIKYGNPDRRGPVSLEDRIREQSRQAMEGRRQ